MGLEISPAVDLVFATALSPCFALANHKAGQIFDIQNIHPMPANR